MSNRGHWVHLGSLVRLDGPQTCRFPLVNTRARVLHVHVSICFLSRDSLKMKTCDISGRGPFVFSPPASCRSWTWWWIRAWSWRRRTSSAGWCRSTGHKQKILMYGGRRFISALIHDQSTDQISVGLKIWLQSEFCVFLWHGTPKVWGFYWIWSLTTQEGKLLHESHEYKTLKQTEKFLIFWEYPDSEELSSITFIYDMFRSFLYLYLLSSLVFVLF